MSVTFTAEVEWRADGKPQSPKNTPLESVAASNAKTGSASAKSLDQVLQIFDAVNNDKALIVVLPFAYAHTIFPEGRSIDQIKIGIYLVSLRATATCKDLKVTKVVPVNNAHSAITLALQGDGFSVERTAALGVP